MIEITEGVPERIEHNLRVASSEMTQLFSLNGIELFNKYIQWVNSHVRMLAGQISEDSIDTLLRTRGYWSLRGADPASLGNNLSDTIRREMEGQKHGIDLAADEVQTQRQRWSGLNMEPVALLLDTGVVEEYATRLLDVDWHQLANLSPHRYIYLVVPRVVVDELDRHKQSRDQNARERRKNARAAIKSLWGMFGSHELASTFTRIDLIPTRQGRVELLNDAIEHVQQLDPDAEVLARSQSLAAYIPVKVVTLDTGMALRGMASGIDVIRVEQLDEPTDRPG
jgi:hypothetical protein